MNRKYAEKGQALVLIAFGAVALFALAALAIDGSRVFSDRRHAQNAADTAAFAGALSKAKGDLPAVYKAAAFTRATSNGYDNNTITNTVTVHDCDDPLYPNKCKGLPIGAVAEDYLRVEIISTIPTTFARVLGRQTVTSAVEAVVHVVPSVPDEMFAGNAVVGLAPTECGAIRFQGSAGTTVTGGGLFVMSSCDSAAFFNNSGAAQLTAPSICAVGNIPPGQPGVATVPSVQSGCEPPPGIIEPNPTCSGAATWSGNTMSPGSYSGHFPPTGVDTLLAGTYCVDGDFRVNGGAILTGIGVTIRMDGGVINWGGAGNAGEIHLKAPTSGDNNGLLIYMPSATNCSTITLNGNSYSEIVGSILAPCSNITVNGTGDSGINGQIIGWTVDLGGNEGSTINYNNALNFDALTLPILESTQ